MEIPNRLLEFDWTAKGDNLTSVATSSSDIKVKPSSSVLFAKHSHILIAVKLYKSLLIKEGFLPCKGPLPSVNEHKKKMSNKSF